MHTLYGVRTDGARSKPPHCFRLRTLHKSHLELFYLKDVKKDGALYMNILQLGRSAALGVGDWVGILWKDAASPLLVVL